MRPLAHLISFGAAMLLTAQAHANTTLDVRGWLERPGVRMVAVEFYATWCKPCMDAVPKWKALHEKYARDGLRLIVVSTLDPDGNCQNPGWSPDEVVCDDEGTIAQAMGVGNRLPAAFLWSWDGSLLVRQGQVEAVEKQVERWMQEAPRVAVEVQKDHATAGRSEEIRALVRTELKRTDKLTLVSTPEERVKLDEIKKQSADPRYDEDSQCELGKELSPNSLLQVRITGKKKRFQLSLLSIERGCLVASVSVQYNADKEEIVVAEAIAKLLGQVRKPPKTLNQPISAGLHVTETGASDQAKQIVDQNTPAFPQDTPTNHALNPETDPKSRAANASPYPLVVGVTGLGAVGTGLLLGQLALSSARSGETDGVVGQAKLADGLIIGGAAVTIAAIIWYFVEANQSP